MEKNWTLKRMQREANQLSTGKASSFSTKRAYTLHTPLTAFDGTQFVHVHIRMSSFECMREKREKRRERILNLLYKYIKCAPREMNASDL